jgi:hypothetical protein
VLFGERQELLAAGLDGMDTSLHRPKCNWCGAAGRSWALLPEVN